MKNLMTRKLVLGMLMTLVLAFSVQGIADALTFGTSRSGDLATELPVPNDFTIRFSVTPKGNTNIENANGDRVDEAENLINSSGYYINADGDYVTTPGGSTVATTTAERVRADMILCATTIAMNRLLSPSQTRKSRKWEATTLLILPEHMS